MSSAGSRDSIERHLHGLGSLPASLRGRSCRFFLYRRQRLCLQPYRVIGVSAGFGADKLVAQFGHTANGMEQLENCSYDCVVSLEGLISRMAKGVSRFVKECLRGIENTRAKRGSIGLASPIFDRFEIENIFVKYRVESLIDLFVKSKVEDTQCSSRPPTSNLTTFNQ